MSDPSVDYELHNLHDLGGFATPDGLIRPGRLFRSANPDALTPKGWQQVLDAGIRTIVDLRNDDELGASARPRELRVERRPIEDQSDIEFMAEWGDRLGSPEYYPEVVRRWPDLVVAAVSAVADAPQGGILIHCMAGRDRTGMVTAILLETLGVEREAIFTDFEQSARQINEWWRIHGGPKGSQTDAEMLEYLAAAEVSLTRFLDELEAPNYLTQAGVTAQQLARIRSHLLDD